MEDPQEEAGLGAAELKRGAYKLLAVDLDGTLVRRDGSIADRDQRAIAELRQGGVHVAIATGRLYAGSRHVAEQLELSGPHVLADGASIVEFPGDRELYHQGIEGGASEASTETLGKHDFAVFVLVGDDVVLDERGSQFEQYLRGWSPRVQRVERVLEHASWRAPRGPSAVVAIGLSEPIRRAEAELSKSERLEVFRFDVRMADGVSTLLLHARGVSKAAGLSRIAEHYGCTLDDVVAVGDWHNDVSMLRSAGLSFAMAHAPPAVKEAASQVLPPTADAGGGVAGAIERAWFRSRAR